MWKKVFSIVFISIWIGNMEVKLASGVWVWKPLPYSYQNFSEYSEKKSWKVPRHFFGNVIKLTFKEINFFGIFQKMITGIALLQEKLHLPLYLEKGETHEAYLIS